MKRQYLFRLAGALIVTLTILNFKFLGISTQLIYITQVMQPPPTPPPQPMVIMIISDEDDPSKYPYKLYPSGRIPTEKCPLQSNCIITYDLYDENFDNHTDVFVVQTSGPLNLNSLNQIKESHPNCSFVWLNQESPMNSHFFGTNYDNKVTLTASYQRDSDIITPYYDVFPIPPDESNKNETIDYARNKTRLIVTFMSHCVSYRMLFINTLSKYLNVSFFGNCQPDKNKQCSRFDQECESYQRTFKFYLAIENSFCTDYVTEKMYFQGLQQGLVPVVLNGGKLNDSTVAPPKSFINVLDFKSTKELADYLLYLDKNDTAYNEYHQWRQKYIVKRHDHICNICKRLWEIHQEGRLGIETVKLSQFYSVQRNCQSFYNTIFTKYLSPKLVNF